MQNFWPWTYRNPLIHTRASANQVVTVCWCSKDLHYIIFERGFYGKICVRVEWCWFLVLWNPLTLEFLKIYTIIFSEAKSVNFNLQPFFLPNKIWHKTILPSVILQLVRSVNRIDEVALASPRPEIRLTIITSYFIGSFYIYAFLKKLTYTNYKNIYGK